MAGQPRPAAIPEGFSEVLKLLHARLGDAPFAWAITGSLGMALQGMALEPRDIDLQTDAEGTHAIEARLAEFVTRPVYLRESERIRSLFGVLEIHGVAVEIMGDVQKRAAGGAWGPPTDLPAVITWVERGEMRLPVIDLRYEQQAYAEMGRLEKSELIRRFLESFSSYP